jgi:hypothetical protein
LATDVTIISDKPKMKNTLKISGFSLLFMLLFFGVVFKMAKADTTNTVLSNLITPSSQEDSTTIDQRLAARRPKVQLSATDKASIAAKCSLAQTAINDRRTKDTKAAAIRLETYNNLVKRLTFLVDNLSSQGSDASELLNAENYFVASINNYLADAGKYKTAMDDLVVMDCKTDPTGFKATLLEARQTRAQLNTDVASVKNNLANLRKSLGNARQNLIKHPVKGTKN